MINPSTLQPASYQMGGASPMQTSPLESRGIHGQYHSNYIQTPVPSQGTGQGMQTPNFGRTLGMAVTGPEVQLSGKHNGLCRYLARLLRPLWNQRLIVSLRNQSGEQVRRYD